MFAISGWMGAESRNPEDVYSAMLIQGVSARDCPGNLISAPQLSARSCQRGFSFSISQIFFPAPALDLLLAADGGQSVLVALVIDQPMDLILPSKAFKRVVLMLTDASVEKPRDSDIERSGWAGKNVDPELVMASVTHAGDRSTNNLAETP